MLDPDRAADRARAPSANPGGLRLAWERAGGGGATGGVLDPFPPPRWRAPRRCPVSL